jgi:hypothetical protein
MSRNFDTVIACPNCNNAVETILWDSVNVTVDKNLKDKVLDRTINTVICDRCNGVIVVIKDLLYHDMDSNYMVYLIPKNLTEEHKSGIKMMQTFMKHKSIRLVKTMDRLVEKINILDNNLNDYYIEAIKLALLKHIIQHIKQTDVIEYVNNNFFIVGVEKNVMGQIEKLRLSFRTEENEILTTEYPFSDYEMASKNMKLTLDPFINEELNAYSFIDSPFVYEILKKQGRAKD